MIRPTKLVVDLQRIVQNAKFLRQITENEFFCPMVKADAYGHGAYQVCRALRTVKVDRFGVALYEEGIELRRLGLQEGQILIFAPMTSEAIKASIEYNLTPVIVRESDAHLVKKHSHLFTNPLSVHLKVQSGMQRLGVSLQQAAATAELLRSVKGVRLQGVCTHLPNAEDVLEQDSSTQKSLQWFSHAVDQIGAVDFQHVFNSSSLILLSQARSPWLKRFGSRPGISLYGAADSDQLGEAMQLRTRVIQVHEVSPGEGVSYGHIWKAKRESKVGILPVGYADGIRRNLSGEFSVLIDGQRLPSIGRVCMDYIMVDLTDLGRGVSDLLDLEAVVLDGGADGMNATAWANKLDTIPYEVMTSFSKRVPREYI